MSSPSRRMLPSTRQLSITSFMRFRQRRKVDLPQPDGPISAVTSLRLMSRSTCLSACFSPYNTLTSRARILTGTAGWVTAAAEYTARGGPVATAGAGTGVGPATADWKASDIVLSLPAAFEALAQNHGYHVHFVYVSDHHHDRCRGPVHVAAFCSVCLVFYL